MDHSGRCALRCQSDLLLRLRVIEWVVAKPEVIRIGISTEKSTYEAQNDREADPGTSPEWQLRIPSSISDQHNV